MAGRIFINYRRGDDAGFTHALFLRLESEFPESKIFMDVEGHIKPGDDFIDVLSRQVAQCDILLAVIGPRWESLLADRNGAADDFVTIEIQSALAQGKRVIPVLVGGASMPKGDALPEGIKQLTRKNAVGLRPERFKADCQGLVNALKEQFEFDTASPAGAASDKRLVDLEQESEAERSRRVALLEESARAQQANGLSVDAIQKVEELANWAFVQAREDARSLRDHLARFPKGVTQVYAQAKLEEIVWKTASETGTPDAYAAYLHEFPSGVFAADAEAEIAKQAAQTAQRLEHQARMAAETTAWAGVATSTDASTITAFLEQWPDGKYANSARMRLDELRDQKYALVRGVWSFILLVLSVIAGVVLLFAVAFLLIYGVAILGAALRWLF